MSEEKENTTNLRLKELEKRVTMLENMFKEHHRACQENAQTLKEVREMIATVKAGMKITNFLRNMVLWFAGLSTAALTLYQAWWKK